MRMQIKAATINNGTISSNTSSRALRLRMCRRLLAFVKREAAPARNSDIVNAIVRSYLRDERRSRLPHCSFHCLNFESSSTSGTVVSFRDTIRAVRAMSCSSGEVGLTADRKSCLLILVFSMNLDAKSFVSLLIPLIWSLHPNRATKRARPLPNRKSVNCEKVSPPVASTGVEEGGMLAAGWGGWSVFVFGAAPLAGNLWCAGVNFTCGRRAGFGDVACAINRRLSAKAITRRERHRTAVTP